MTFLITLAVCITLSFLLRIPIKKVPWLFYLLALALTVLFLARSLVSLPPAIDKVFFSLMQKCIIAESLFIVVMYIGTLNVKSKVRQWLQPVRAELSIIACILALAHVTSYLGSFGARILFSSASYNGFLTASFCISCILLVLLVVLGITSFEFLKQRMHTKTWIRVQILAYVFYGLTYIHILLCLLPPALGGGITAQVSVAIYSLLFVLYAVLRLRRWSVDKRLRQASPQAIKESAVSRV